MKSFKAVIRADKYPSEYYIEASSWATATARAVRQWSKTKGKGSKTDSLHIRISKGGTILREEDDV